MVDTVRYVNLASSGGDGTTNATSGATAAYATLAAWDAAEATTIGSGDRHIVYLTGQGSEDNTQTTIGSDWDGAGELHVLQHEDDRHNGVIGNRSSGYIFTNGIIIQAQVDTQIYELVAEVTAAYTGTYLIEVSSASSTVANSITIRDFRWHQGFASGTTLFLGNTDNTLNLHTGVSRQDRTDRANIRCGFGTLNARNVTSEGGNNNLDLTGGTFNAYNTVAFNGSSVDFDTGIGGNYNASSDATAPGANSLTTITPASEFTNTTTDFSLLGASNLIGAGDDLSAFFTDDIINATYSTDDIGAFANGVVISSSYGFMATPVASPIASSCGESPA